VAVFDQDKLPGLLPGSLWRVRLINSTYFEDSGLLIGVDWSFDRLLVGCLELTFLKVAIFVYSMALLVVKSIESGEHTTLKDLQRITGEKDFVPQTAEEIVGRLLHTVSIVLSL
jgi:hypothetical protein